MPQENLLIALHFILLWGSVTIGLVAGLLLPVSNLIAIPLAVILWAFGFFYNFRLVQTRPAYNPNRPGAGRKSYERITARTLMNLGIAIVFRSWITLIAAIILIPLYTWAARKKRQYLDSLHGHGVADVFPDRSETRSRRS